VISIACGSVRDVLERYGGVDLTDSAGGEFLAWVGAVGLESDEDTDHRRSLSFARPTVEPFNSPVRF
jgi:hypothetical protein